MRLLACCWPLFHWTFYELPYFVCIYILFNNEVKMLCFLKLNLSHILYLWVFEYLDFFMFNETD